MAPVVAAEPVWSTLLAATESVWGAVFELSVPGCSCPRAMQVDIDAATSTQLLVPPAPCSRCVQVQPNVQLEIEELISIDIMAILMLGCMVGATFFIIMLQLRAHAADAAVWLFCLRDERDVTTPAVEHMCC